jgi:hypothetical protein
MCLQQTKLIRIYWAGLVRDECIGFEIIAIKCAFSSLLPLPPPPALRAPL